MIQLLCIIHSWHSHEVFLFKGTFVSTPVTVRAGSRRAKKYGSLNNKG